MTQATKKKIAAWIPLSSTHGGRRAWRTKSIVAGWRLEFRDFNDTSWTGAGVHSSRDRAERAAR